MSRKFERKSKARYEIIITDKPGSLESAIKENLQFFKEEVSPNLKRAEMVLGQRKRWKKLQTRKRAQKRKARQHN